MKAAGSVGLKHRSSWQRMALVTDIDWVKYGASAFGWLARRSATRRTGWRDEARALLGETSSVQGQHRLLSVWVSRGCTQSGAEARTACFRPRRAPSA
jgi:hypothetical protein